jgi:hypothetical protein
MANCNAWSCKIGRTSDVADDPPPRPARPPVHGRQQMDKAHAKFVGRKGKVGAGPSRLPAVSHSGVSVYPRASLQKTSRSVCSQVWCAQWPAGAAAGANRSGPLRSAAGASSSPRPRCVDSTTRTAHYESFAVSGTGCNVRGPRARPSTCSTSGPWPVRPGRI